MKVPTIDVEFTEEEKEDILTMFFKIAEMCEIAKKRTVEAQKKANVPNFRTNSGPLVGYIAEHLSAMMGIISMVSSPEHPAIAFHSVRLNIVRELLIVQKNMLIQNEKIIDELEKRENSTHLMGSRSDMINAIVELVLTTGLDEVSEENFAMMNFSDKPTEQEDIESIVQEVNQYIEDIKSGKRKRPSQSAHTIH